MKEQETVKAILEWLSLSRMFHWRNNTGGMRYLRPSGGEGFMRFGSVGSPDIFVVKPAFEKHINIVDRESFCGAECVFGQIVGIEVKSAKGKQSPAQREWQEKFERAGGRYVLARSLDDVTRACG